MFVMGKSQTSTEYLVILAVVIIIALVAINTLGGFPGIGSNNNKKVSDFKLSSDTIGIESYSIGANSSIFKLKNNYFDTITVTEFRVNQQSNLTCNSSNTNPSLPVVLNIGESKLINCSAVNSSNYAITNKQTPVVGISYTDNLGATRTAGNVQSYNSTSSGNENQSGGQPYVPSSTVLDLRNGLVAYYPLDGNTSDLSGNGNTGTNIGASYNQSGKVGGAYSFNGDSSTVEIPTLGLGGTSQVTFNMWVKSNRVSGSWTTPLIRSRGGYYDATMLIIGGELQGADSQKLDFFVYDGSFYGNMDFSTSIVPVDDWTMVTFSMSGTTWKIYVNGALEKTYGYDRTILEDSTWKLGWDDYDVYNLLGSMDEVSIWNRALTDSEVTQLYNNDSGLSLSLSGPQAPDCQADEINCSNTNYLTCTNGVWVNNGDVSGHCGFYIPESLSELRNGLVAYYPLDGNTSDLSGNGNDGTNSGATYTQSGKLGGAYSFDGSNDYINVPDSSVLDLTNQITLSAWVYISNYVSWGGIVGKGDGSFGPYSMQLGSGNSNLRLSYNMQDPWTNYLDSNSIISQGQWSLVTITYDGSNVKHYINGNLDRTTSFSTSFSQTNADICIGCDPPGANEFFNGKVDEVAIWNRALVDGEILQLYNSTNGYSLSLSGAQAPICAAGQTQCNSTRLLSCTNGNWVDLGNVSGNCGYTNSSTLSYSMSTWNRTYLAGETLPSGIYYLYEQYDPGHSAVMDHNGKLYAGYYRGYVYSTDEGNSWTLVDVSGLINSSTRWTVIATSFDGQRIWLSIPGVGTYVSKDSGATFNYETQLSSLNYADGIVKVLQSPYHSNHLIAYTARQTGYGQVGGLMYRSIDSGDTWQNLNPAIASAGSVGPSYSDPITFEPNNTTTFYYMSMPSSCPGTPGAYITNNGGTSFTQITGATACYASGIERAANGATGRLLIGGACTQLKYSPISSFSWSGVSGANSGCGGWDLITAHPLNLSKMLISRGTLYSTNGGTTAQSCSIPSLNSGDWVGYSQIVNPNQDGVFYMISYYGKIIKSTNGGATFASVGAIPYSQYDT